MLTEHEKSTNTISQHQTAFGTYDDAILDTSTSKTANLPLERFLPAPLITARAKAMNPRYCQDLTRPARMALWGILAFINLKDTNKPIFPKRELLLTETMLGSQPTLYRALAQLEERGYIRREQTRRRAKETYGQYSISYIWITPRTQALLGLHNPSPAPTYSQQPSITTRDRIQEIELTNNQQPIQEQLTLPTSLPQTTPPKESSLKNKPQKFNIPKELQPLQTLGLSQIHICTLMKKAKQVGVSGTLGAIVRTTWERLTKIKKSALFAYLSTLVRQPKDWSISAKEQELKQERAQQKESEKRDKIKRLSVLREKFLGKTAVHVDGRQLGILFESGKTLWLRNIENGIYKLLPVNQQFICAWVEGRISF